MLMPNISIQHRRFLIHLNKFTVMGSLIKDGRKAKVTKDGKKIPIPSDSGSAKAD